MRLSTKPRVVLDSNVFVSAIVWGGNPEKILNLWLRGKFDLFISPEILLETLDVLAKFQVSSRLIEQIKNLIEIHGQRLIPKSNFKICRDLGDNKFLNLCFDCQADYLVTGDKDLLALKRFKKTKILKPKEFLKRFI
jgi:putative PIN family toxin of toxin-antitoxin system